MFVLSCFFVSFKPVSGVNDRAVVNQSSMVLDMDFHNGRVWVLLISPVRQAY